MLSVSPNTLMDLNNVMTTLVTYRIDLKICIIQVLEVPQQSQPTNHYNRLGLLVGASGFLDVFDEALPSNSRLCTW